MMKYMKKTIYFILLMLNILSFMAYAASETMDMLSIHDAMKFSDVESSVDLENPAMQQKTSVNEVTVEPVAIVGIHSLYGMDFSAALEALSIANYDVPVIYPVYISSASRDLAELYDNAQALELLKKHQWSKWIINENDYVLRQDIFSSYDTIMSLKEQGIQQKTELILLQAPDSLYDDFDQLGERKDQALVNGQKIANLGNIRFIPMAHLLARLKQDHQIAIIADDGKEITIQGLWAMAAIVYMGLENRRPANPDFSRLYPDLQELIKPFTQIEIDRRLYIIDAAWEEYKRYNRLKK